jgi:predicted MFS family arabinose efflux permease
MVNIHPHETKYILEPNEHAKFVNEKSHKIIDINVNEDIPHSELGSPAMASPSLNEERKPLLVPSNTDPHHNLGNWEALSILVMHRSFWVIVFDGLCVNWGYYIFLTWLPTYVTTELGFSLQAAGIIAITPNISSAIVGYISGAVCDQLIKRGYRLIILRKTFFFVGCLLYAITLVLLAKMNDLGISPVMAAVILAIGTSGGGLHIPGYSANIFDIAPNHPSIVVGVSNTAATIPGIIGVYSTGLLLDRGLGWGFIWMLTAGFYVVAMIANTLFADVKRVV